MHQGIAKPSSAMFVGACLFLEQGGISTEPQLGFAVSLYKVQPLLRSFSQQTRCMGKNPYGIM